VSCTVHALQVKTDVYYSSADLSDTLFYAGLDVPFREMPLKTVTVFAFWFASVALSHPLCAVYVLNIGLFENLAGTLPGILFNTET